MDLLLNFDDTRTSTYSETIKVPDTGVWSLKYIPKLNSISIPGYSIITAGVPQVTQALIDYKADRDYYSATGELTFNAASIGQTVTIMYVPVGSRVDANDINPMLQWYSNMLNNLYTKDDLKTNGKANVAWGNISGAPSNATESASGFMSFVDKRAVNTIDPLKKPFGSLVVDTNTVYSPTAWGGPLNLKSTGTIKASLIDGILSFNLSPDTKGLVSDNILAALAGTGGVPSSSNKFVTEDDDRFKSSSVPPHEHEEADVKSLVADLSNRSLVGHQHGIGDVTGLVTALDGKSPVGHTQGMDTISGLSAALLGKSDLGHRHSDLETLISQKAPIKHTHLGAEILDLASYIPSMPPAGSSSGSSVTKRDIYSRAAGSFSIASLISDYHIAGYDVTAGSGFMVNVSAGAQYAGGVLLGSTGTQTFNTIAPAPVVATGNPPATAYPIVTGTYNGTAPLDLILKVLQPNSATTSLNNLTVDVYNGTTHLQTFSYTSNAPQEVAISGAGTGIYVTFNIDTPVSYITDYSWEINYQVDKDVYLYLDASIGGLSALAVAHGAAQPATPALCSTLAKVVTNASGIVSVTPMRPSDGPPVLKDVRVSTQAITDDSTKIASTGFVHDVVDNAMSTEVTNRGTAITNAINTEATNRNEAISSAISTEVTNRNSAINNAVSGILYRNQVEVTLAAGASQAIQIPAEHPVLALAICILGKSSTSLYVQRSFSDLHYELDVSSGHNDIVVYNTSTGSITARVTMIGG